MQFLGKKRQNLNPPDDGPVYLTLLGKQKLSEKLERVNKELPALIAETERTAAYGDRSENVEYTSAKSALRRAHGQIIHTKDLLRRAVIIEPGKNKSGKVQLGSTVVLETQTGERKVFQILGPMETDPERGRISHLSPLGAALMSRKSGEKVQIKTERGTREYKILEIR